MRSLARLKRLRLLEERMAGAALTAARSEAEAAARAVTENERKYTEMGREMLDAVLLFDPASAYLKSIARSIARENWPALKKDAANREVVHQSMTAGYFEARRKHSMLEVLLRNEEAKANILSQRKAQREMDEAYLRQRQ